MRESLTLSFRGMAVRIGKAMDVYESMGSDSLMCSVTVGKSLSTWSCRPQQRIGGSSRSLSTSKMLLFLSFCSIRDKKWDPIPAKL